MSKKLVCILLGIFVSFSFSSILFAQTNESDREKHEETLNDMNLTDLQGGSEAEERKNPVSHLKLQQKYPETVLVRGPMTKPQVALTFDDGPDPRFTPQILDILKEYKVKATFFVMGSRAKAYPDLVKRMINEGHIVANHTYWHPNLVKVDKATLRREVTQTEETLENIIGYKTKLFRPPYGFLTNEHVEALAALDYSVIFWSVDTLDWRELSPENIALNALSNIHPGAIILMHDGAEWDEDRTNTVKSLHQIIPTLKEQGMELVTVPELVNIPFKK